MIARAGEDEGLSTAESAFLGILRSALGGQITPEYAAKQMATLAEVKEFQQIIAENQPEAYTPTIVRGSGKTTESIVSQIQSLLPHQRTVLATRIEAEVYEAVKAHLPEVEYNVRARTLSLRSDQSSKKATKLPGTVAIISGSSPDLRVAEECRLVAEHLGCYVFQLKDLKVANLSHILTNITAIRAADVVVVVSGLDGALPALLAGLVEAPVIAVPTSAGHGATLNGVAPMLASICSSTPVSVVNIDDGKSAAMMAMRILRQSSKLHDKRVKAAAAAATSNGSSGVPPPAVAWQVAPAVPSPATLPTGEVAGARCAWPSARAVSN